MLVSSKRSTGVRLIAGKGLAPEMMALFKSGESPA